MQNTFAHPPIDRLTVTSYSKLAFQRTFGLKHIESQLWTSAPDLRSLVPFSHLRRNFCIAALLERTVKKQHWPLLARLDDTDSLDRLAGLRCFEVLLSDWFAWRREVVLTVARRLLLLLLLVLLRDKSTGCCTTELLLLLLLGQLLS